MPGLPYLRKLSLDDFKISVILSFRVLKYGNISQKSWKLNTRTFSFQASCARSSAGGRAGALTERRESTLVRETTRALGGGCSLRSYCFILPIDGAVTGTLNFDACVKMVSPPMRFFNRVSASYLSGCEALIKYQI